MHWLDNKVFKKPQVQVAGLLWNRTWTSRTRTECTACLCAQSHCTAGRLALRVHPLVKIGNSHPQQNVTSNHISTMSPALHEEQGCAMQLQYWHSCFIFRGSPLRISEVSPAEVSFVISLRFSMQMMRYTCIFSIPCLLYPAQLVKP